MTVISLIPLSIFTSHFMIIVSLDGGIIFLILLTLYDFYLMLNNRACYIDRSSTYDLTLHPNEITLTSSFVFYENDFKSNSNSFPWVSYGGPIHMELDS